MNVRADRVPVTVLTGFLGSGKTTLLNRILTEQHGKRIAVIENEFGEIGIDQALVINADEEVFEMNNGCICCTVRGDLIRILGNLMRRRDKFDHILVETTGLADPGPVAQTFFMDDEMREQFVLDGIVTLVDSKHVSLHLDESDECRAQVAFADVLVLNKTDLVTEPDLEALEARVRGMNAMARIVRAERGEVPIPVVLDVGGFDLARALEQKPTFLEPEYPFEWAGIYELPEGPFEIELADGLDETMSLALLPLAPGDTLLGSLERGVRVFAEPAERVRGRDLGRPGVHRELELRDPGIKRFTGLAPVPGRYLLLTEHLPEELSMRLEVAGRELAAVEARALAAAHQHDESVSSVGLELEGDVDENELNKWMSTLLRERGTDIFRMKGIFSVAGSDRRFVFQGVHMLVDAREDRAWGDEPRKSQLVFIGRGLDRAALAQGLRACRA